MSSVFGVDLVQKLADKYKNEVRPEHGGSSRGGCMKAVYVGLGALFGDRYGFRGDFHKAFFRKTRRDEEARGLPEGRLNTIDRVFRELETEGLAFAEQTFRPVSGKWLTASGDSLDSLENELGNQVRTLPSGSQFFGVAVDGAIHSLLLRVDKMDAGVAVYWMDQFSDGFDAVRPGGFVTTPNVTGRLDDELRAFGSNATSVWRLKPEMASTPA